MTKKIPPKVKSLQSRDVRGVVLAFAVLIFVTLMNGAYAIIVGNRNTNVMVSNSLEERLNVADSVLQYELRELDFVGGIVREQEQKIIHYLDFDKLRPIQVMLQTIALKQSMDKVFFLDEDKQLLVTNSRIVGEDAFHAPYERLVSVVTDKAGLERLPSSFFQDLSTLDDSTHSMPEMLTVMKRVVPMYHDLGDTYGYVVLIKFINGNESIAEELAEATGSPFVIYNSQHQAILSSFSSSNISYPDDDRLALSGISYVSKMIPLYDLSGDVLAELGVFLDQTILMKQRRRQMFNVGLPLAVISCIVLVLFRMMDNLKKSYWQLERARHEAEAANIAKSEFLANMSHEIRTPLNAIVGLGSLALKTHLTEQQHDYLTKIKSSSNVLLDLINNILDFSKIEARKLVIESVRFRCEDILQDVESIALGGIEEKDVDLVFFTSSRVPQFLKGDPTRIFQVLLNLVTNAIKFTARGQIIVTTDIVLRSSGNNKEVVLQFSVQDQGIGLSESQVAKLFDAFTQGDSSTTREFGGTGLGLTICKELVELMGGKITVASDLGKGSLFLFTVLVEQVEQEEGALKLEDGSKISLEEIRGASILLVEDNLINQQVATELLQSEGFVVTVVGNGFEAVEAVTGGDANSDFDLVLMDIQMPVMDGYDATREIRSSSSPNNNIPIVAMTAHALSSQCAQCLDAGMNEHVIKPFDVDMLFAVLVKWIKPENITRKSKVSVPGPGRRKGEIDLPRALPGLDIEDGLERVAGNPVLYLKLLSLFRANSADCDAKIKDFLRSSRGDEVQKILHQLKGVAGNSGARKLYESARKFEAGICETGREELDELHQDFTRELGVVLQSIQILEGLQSDISHEQAVVPTGIAIDLREVKMCCANIRKLILNDYGAAIDAVASLRAMVNDVVLDEKIDSLEQFLEGFREEKALLCLHELEKSLPGRIE